MLDDQRNRARGAGADLLVLPPGMSAIGLSSAPMSEKLVEVVRSEDHVILATGAVIQPLGGIKRLTGIDFRTFDRMAGGFRFLAGGPFQEPYDAIIDEYYAKQQNLALGDSLDFLDRQWRVRGIVEPGKMARILLPVQTLQELTGNTGKITMVYAKLDDPAQSDVVIASLKEKLRGYQVYSIDEFISQFSVDRLPELQAFIGVIIALSVGFGFLIIFLTMHTAVLERTREIGILKSLGATPGYILHILVIEAAALAALGTALGISASFGTRELIRMFIPASMQQAIVPEWWLIAAGITLCGAFLGVLYPAYKAARQDVIESLSHD
jgi:putative ABC transport system permease protein